MEDTLKKAIKINTLLTLITALVLAVTGQLRWAGGFLTGSVWSTVNFLLLVNILKIAILEKEKKGLVPALLLKFPVLYLGGFLILTLEIFPVLSLLAGVSLILAVIGLVKLWPKLT